jgi:tetratricopeptide (TPR) repeat protein
MFKLSLLSRITLSLTVLLLAGSLQAATLEDVQSRWAEANYTLEGDAQIAALESLVATLSESLAGGEDPALLIWDGIVKSTLAGKKGGLGALSLVKDARRSLEKALALDPMALDGSAYTSLGALYYQVPGWPVGFGDDDKARELLEKAVALNPDGIDSNYFYGDFLAQEKDYEAARVALEKALAAPDRPLRPLADKGRREEIRVLLASLP